MIIVVFDTCVRIYEIGKGLMPMEQNYSPLPMMGTILQGETSATLAKKIYNLFTETSLSKIQEEYEKLKALMSCYQCALLEVETKFREKLQRKGLPFTAGPQNAESPGYH